MGHTLIVSPATPYVLQLPGAKTYNKKRIYLLEETAELLVPVKSLTFSSKFWR
jgi:hypothetical protein